MDKVYAAISDETLVDLTRRLISIPSPNFEEGAVADFIADRMARCGMKVEMMDVVHPREAGGVTRQPVGRLPGSGGGRTLMFNGHGVVLHVMALHHDIAARLVHPHPHALTLRWIEQAK